MTHDGLSLETSNPARFAAFDRAIRTSAGFERLECLAKAWPKPLREQVVIDPAELYQRAAGLGRPGVTAQFSWPRHRSRVGVGIETPVAHALVDRLLGDDRTPAQGRLQVTPVEWGILSYLFLHLLNHLAKTEKGSFSPLDLSLDRVGPDPFDGRDLGAVITARWGVRIGETLGAFRLWLPESLISVFVSVPTPPTPSPSIQKKFDPGLLMMTIADAPNAEPSLRPGIELELDPGPPLDSAPEPQARCGPQAEALPSLDSQSQLRPEPQDEAPPWLDPEPHAEPSPLPPSEPPAEALSDTGPWRARFGSIKLPRGLQTLRVGRVLPTDEPGLSGLPADPEGLIHLIRLDPAGDTEFLANVEAGSGGRRLVIQSTLIPTPPPDENLGTSLVYVEIGSAMIPADRLATLAAGDLVELQRDDDLPVTLLAEGRAVARGELVAIESELGVRLLEILD